MNLDLNIPDKRLAAVCGLFCPSCPIFIGSRENKNRLTRLAEHFQCSVEDLECEGCRSEKVCNYSCKNCNLSKCAAEKGFDFCGECPEYPCDELRAFQAAMPNRLELWQSQDRIKEVGWEQWYTEMIKHYSCFKCGTLNSVADRSCRNCQATPSCMYVKIHEDEIDHHISRRPPEGSLRTYVSQTLESNSCGAHSIAYYLWETNKSQSINDKEFVTNIHKKIKIGPNKVGIPEIYSSPGKMADELTNYWHSPAKVSILSNSYLIPVAKGLNIAYENENILDNLRNGDNKYVIIITTIGYQTNALHYMLTKYENGEFILLDSLNNLDHATFKMTDKVYEYDHVVWEKFVLDPTGKLILDRASNYYWTGAGIRIK